MEELAYFPTSPAWEGEAPSSAPRSPDPPPVLRTLVNTMPLDGTPYVAPYVPCPPELVEKALALAHLHPTDTLLDLGCGDARLLTTALRRCPGIRVLGVELDPFLLAHIRSQHAESLAQGTLRLLEADMNTLDLEGLGASVLVLYLLPAGLAGLAPGMAAWLARGPPQNLFPTTPTPPARRIVTIDYPVPGWRVHQRKDFMINGYPKSLYYYVHPTCSS